MNYILIEHNKSYILLKDTNMAGSSLTNSIESVIVELVNRSILDNGQHLFYVDSGGELTEAIYTITHASTRNSRMLHKQDVIVTFDTFPEITTFDQFREMLAFRKLKNDM
jgi:hypothetical protein